MYKFMCNTKYLLEIAEELFRKMVKMHGSEDLPDNLQKMGLHIVEYKQQYHRLLEAICDDLPKLF